MASNPLYRQLFKQGLNPSCRKLLAAAIAKPPKTWHTVRHIAHKNGTRSSEAWAYRHLLRTSAITAISFIGLYRLASELLTYHHHQQSPITPSTPTPTTSLWHTCNEIPTAYRDVTMLSSPQPSSSENILRSGKLRSMLHWGRANRLPWRANSDLQHHPSSNLNPTTRPGNQVGGVPHGTSGTSPESHNKQSRDGKHSSGGTSKSSESDSDHGGSPHSPRGGSCLSDTDWDW